MRFVILSILFALLAPPALSAPANCQKLASSHRLGYWVNDKTPCYCGSQLSNLTVTLPAGLRVETVCELRYYSAEGRNYIDLTREKVSLDSYRQGDYLKGGIFLSGTTQTPITGTVVMEEGPEGSILKFHTSKKHNPQGPVLWEGYLASISLGTDQHYKQLRTPKRTANSCWVADATVQLRNPAVLLGDSDAAGTTADLVVIHVSEYRRC